MKEISQIILTADFHADTYTDFFSRQASFSSMGTKSQQKLACNDVIHTQTQTDNKHRISNLLVAH